jgi:hypothetical protein
MKLTRHFKFGSCHTKFHLNPLKMLTLVDETRTEHSNKTMYHYEGAKKGKRKNTREKHKYVT